MADWTFLPNFDQSVSSGPPKTLQTPLEDGKVISRVKHTNVPERWSEVYTFSGSQFDTAKAFYDSKGVATPFTKLGYDVAGSPTVERTVRFDGPWQWQRAGQDYFLVTLAFVRHY